MTDRANTEAHLAAGAKPRRGSLMVAMLPLAMFVALVLVFYFGLYRGDPSKIPSALIGRPAPELALAPLEGLLNGDSPVPGIDAGDLKRGRVSVVNVWASWCGPCRLEHPFLLRLAEDETIDMIGINYKDQPANARRFLGMLGNPYSAVGVDDTGKAAIEWGVHGVPETFIIDAKGTVIYKHIGPIGNKAMAEQVLPAIRRAREP